MKFRCISGLCDGQSYVLDAARETRVVRARLRGMKGILIDCPGCRVASEMRLRTSAGTTRKEAKAVSCPIAGCGGWVSDVPREAIVSPVDGGDYWGCGECGRVWSNVDGPQFEDIAELFPRMRRKAGAAPKKTASPERTRATGKTKALKDRAARATGKAKARKSAGGSPRAPRGRRGR